MPIDPNDTPANVSTSSPTFTVSDAQILGNAGNRTNPVQAVANYLKQNGSVGRYQFPLDLPKYYMTMETSLYSRQSLTKLNFTTKDTLILPMPTSLVDLNTVSYEEGKVGIASGGLMNAYIGHYNDIKKSAAASQSDLSPSAAALQALGKTVTDPAAIAQTLVGGGTAFAEEATGLVNNVVGLATGVKKAIPDADTLIGLAGYAPNQFFVVLLNGPTYKEFTIQWRLYPRSLKESQAIKRICNKLNNAKAVGLEGLFWSFPLIFRLGFHPNASYLYKFKPAVLEQLAIDYAPNGTNAFFNSGAPDSVQITCTFKEMEYWLESDFTDSDDIKNEDPKPPRNGSHETPGEK